MFFKIINALFRILSVEIVECDAAQNCSSQGICGPDGACDCDCGFYMDDCSSKHEKLYFVFKIVLTYCKKIVLLILEKLWIWGQELIEKNNLFKQEKDRTIFEIEY